MRAMLAQLGMELRLMGRRGESLLVTLGIPLALLVFFASIDLFAQGGAAAIVFLAPGLIALAVMSSALVSLGIATGYERHYGVLKRLGGTPLTRAQLIGAKIMSVLLLEALQVALLGGLAALVYGWRPATAGIAPGLALVLLGTAAFAGIGLAMAGRLRAEATLALANGLYLVLLLSGGFFVPLDHLPAVVAVVAPYLPAAALADGLRAALTGGAVALQPLLVLLIWAVGAVALAVATFRWE